MLGLIAVVQWFLLSQTPYIEDPGTTSDQGLRFIEYFATFVAIMVPIVYSFASAFEENPKPPDAIVVIILAIALFYLSFVVVFVYKMMIPDRYREAEVFYVSLSFVTKTSLHWVSELLGGGYPSRLLTHARTAPAPLFGDDGTKRPSVHLKGGGRAEHGKVGRRHGLRGGGAVAGAHRGVFRWLDR